MIARKHSRLPVYRGSPEKIVGILHYKDLLPVWEERRSAIRSGKASRSFHIGRLLRPHLVVPETEIWWRPAATPSTSIRTKGT